jgi:hypothetical protein
MYTTFLSLEMCATTNDTSNVQNRFHRMEDTPSAMNCLQKGQLCAGHCYSQGVHLSPASPAVHQTVLVIIATVAD